MALRIAPLVADGPNLARSPCAGETIDSKIPRHPITSLLQDSDEEMTRCQVAAIVLRCVLFRVCEAAFGGFVRFEVSGEVGLGRTFV